EHVGEDRHPVTAVDAGDRVDDVLAALLDVVIGADRDRLDLPLGPHHRLEGSLGAPHERPAIMTIQRPHARAFPLCWGRCCTAINRGELGFSPASVARRLCPLYGYFFTTPPCRGAGSVMPPP